MVQIITSKGKTVHIKFCKYVLRVGTQTPNADVLGECGRYPLYADYFKKVIVYWLKILKMEDTHNVSVTYC